MEDNCTRCGRKLEIYFGYLDRLRSLCVEKGLPFEIADRVFYVFDKKKNGALRRQRIGS